MIRCIYQEEKSPGFFHFRFDSNELVNVDTNFKVCCYYNLNLNCFNIQFSFTVINDCVFPNVGGIDLPEAVLIALNRLYKEVDYETEND